jgi:protein subunit release factor B
MPSFGVRPEKQQELERRMAACGLREADLDERFIRSGGPGGQKVNRTATCVQLRHSLSGLEVKMQQARSQALNRFHARRRLCELLEARQLGADSPEALERERIRKRKLRRRRRARKADDGGPATG